MKGLNAISSYRLVTKLLVFCSFLGLVFTSNAQQPAYFKLGEEEFKGVQIYDVIQDNYLNYLFATNEGIYYFDHYSYQKIECPKSKSSSVFNFVIDAEGVVYCHNLNNQIFKIKQAQCEVFYELKSDEISSDISLVVTSENNLVIGARKIIVLNNKGTVVVRHDFVNRYLGSSFTAPNKSIHFHLGGCDTILVYGSNSFSKHRLTISSGSFGPNSVLRMFYIKSRSFAFDLKTSMLYDYDPVNFKLTLLPKNKLLEVEGLKRVYETGSEIWIAGTLPGVGRFNGKDSDFFYEDHFISNVYKDKEGNVLLSTFDKGVLVVPDQKIPDVINAFRDDPVTAIHISDSYGLILGTSKGKLMNYTHGELTVLKESAKRSIEGIYGDLKGDIILFDNGGGCVYNMRTQQMQKIVLASLKDVVIASESKIFIATNLGIYETTRSANNKFDAKLMKGMNQRVYALEYDKGSACIYASTANGFFKIDSLGNFTKIRYQNEDIFPTSLYESGGSIYACTEKDGILIIKDGIVLSSLYAKVNGKIVAVKKLIINDHTLIASSTGGLYQFNMQGDFLRSISTAFGFSTKKVIDFKMLGNDIWISHSGGVQSVNLDFALNHTKPIIRFDRVLVNDKVVTSSGNKTFESGQRKVQFVFCSPTLKNRQSIKYHYKLLGYDTAWIVSDFAINQVTYNALDAGTYKFVVKAEDQSKFSNEAAFSFTITKPIYARWWFIILMSSIGALLLFLVYQWQLRVQKRKLIQINELNASKLAAIQSQMNPHFIFNSLNSIQDLVLKGDVENSYSYITTFSDLVRRTLSYSEKDFIEFEQEVKLLELYLSLEKLRFKRNFNFTIDIGNAEDIMIPPMLIQPFIENSLAHGLLHKEGEKNLKISFELKDMLICRIEDNGIGREKARAIKQRQNTKHESFSGKAIGKRLEILSDVFEGDFGYVYEDLFAGTEAIGTRVVLTIPIRRKF